MRRALAGLLVALALAGCYTPPNYPDVELAKMYRREPGKIRIGDYPNYVRSQWGPPSDIDKILHEGGQDEWWYYPGGAVHFSNGAADFISN